MENIYLENLNYLQIKKLNKIYLIKKKKFVIYLNKFISQQNVLTSISPIFSRNLDLSPTYYYYCLIILIRQIYQKKKHLKIFTSNYILFKFLKENLKNTNKIKISYSGSRLNKLKFFFSNILKYRKFFFILYFILIELICKIKYKKSKSQLAKIKNSSRQILVDTTLIKSSFGKKKYYDRFYGDFVKKYKSQILFTEENLLFSKSIKSLTLLEKENLKFLFKFNILSIIDYLFALKKVFFSNLKNIDKFYKFDNINFKILINNDVKNSFCNFNFFYGFLNYRFFLKLKKKNFKFKKIINWNENQSADKGFILGVNTFFPKTELIGYSPSFVNYNFFFDRQPIIQEIKKKLVPKKMYLSSQRYFKDFKMFSKNEISLYRAPLFRFEYLKNKKIIFNKNLKNILVLMPIEKNEVRNIMNYVKFIPNNYNISIKFHPNFSNYEINKYKRVYKKFFYVDTKFHKLIDENDIIVTNSSSAAIEAVLNGKHVISPVNSLFLISTPVINFFNMRLFKLVFSPSDMKQSIREIKYFTGKDLYLIKELKSSLFNKNINITSL